MNSEPLLAIRNLHKSFLVPGPSKLLTGTFTLAKFTPFVARMVPVKAHWLKPSRAPFSPIVGKFSSKAAKSACRARSMHLIPALL